MSDNPSSLSAGIELTAPDICKAVVQKIGRDVVKGFGCIDKWISKRVTQIPCRHCPKEATQSLSFGQSEFDVQEDCSLSVMHANKLVIALSFSNVSLRVFL